MSALLLNLHDVPDDEADDLRDLLERHNIAFYETKPSPWGVSAGGIWIKHTEDMEKARRLMSEYEIERKATAQAEYRAARQRGMANTVWSTFRREPLRVFAALIGIAFVLALMALPFVFMR
jgi:hypothetical protein